MGGRAGATAEGTNLYRAAVDEGSDCAIVWLVQKMALVNEGINQVDGRNLNLKMQAR